MKKIVTITVVFLAIISMIQFFFSSGLSGDGGRTSKLIIKVLDKNHIEIQNANVTIIPSLYSTVANYHNTTQKTDEEGNVILYRRGGWGFEATVFWLEHSASFRELKFKITKEGYQDEILNIKRERYKWYEIFGINLLGAPPQLFEYTVELNPL